MKDKNVLENAVEFIYRNRKNIVSGLCFVATLIDMIEDEKPAKVTNIKTIKPKSTRRKKLEKTAI